LGDSHLGAVAPAPGGDAGLKVKEAPVVRGNSLGCLWQPTCRTVGFRLPHTWRQGQWLKSRWRHRSLRGGLCYDAMQVRVESKPSG
jgi:hypothetical protein